MKVLVAKKCGFCHGVRNAISIAEKVLSQARRQESDEARGTRHEGRETTDDGRQTMDDEHRVSGIGNRVYSLGSIIHNKDVVEKLAKDGLKQLEIDECPLPIERDKSEIANRKSKIPATVLIPSHGAAPAKIAKLKEKGLNIVDATCVLVKRVQHIAEELERDGYKVVIIGDENHPEVKAVVGCAKDVTVLANESDLHKLDSNSRLGIVCQTTQSPDYFGEMLGAIGRYGFSELKVINTLCQEAIKRQESAVQLCRQVDIMFVLGGLQSANTRKLAELCKKVNNQTFHLQNWNELDKSILFGLRRGASPRRVGKNIAGVTAGASTPDWIIAEFVKNLEDFDDR